MKYPIVAALLLTFGLGYCLVQGYKVEPKTAAQSGWTHGEDGYVSEIITTNFDSLTDPCYIECFVGDGNPTGYKVEVLTYPGPGQVPVAWGYGAASNAQAWARFSDLNVTHPELIVKGRQLEVRFSRASGSDSLEYYWSDGDPYKYGFLVTDQPHAGQDLAMRCYARLNAVASTDFGASVFIPAWGQPNPHPRRNQWTGLVDTIGLSWGLIQARWYDCNPKPDTYHFYDLDAHILQTMDKWDSSSGQNMTPTTGIRPVALLFGCPKWASTRVDPIVGRDSLWPQYLDTCVHCASRNLFLDVHDPDNCWARYLDTLLGHFYADEFGVGNWRPFDSVHTFEIENEPNDTCWDVWEHPGVTGWWRRPNLDYLTGFDGLRGLCSLYMRLAVVADSVIRGHEVHQNDTILIGSMHRAVEGNSHFLVRGDTWLDTCYAVWGSRPIFWNGISFHPYQEQHDGFSAAELDTDVAAIRSVMRARGDYGSELWVTEIGWNNRDKGMSKEVHANDVGEVLAATQASRANPEGGLDGPVCWWYSYHDGLPHWDEFGLIETSLVRQPASFAFQQACSLLTGKRFNGRVMTGDARDGAMRTYEFEDSSGKRTWVAWLNPDAPNTAVSLPGRNDEMDTVGLAYDGTPPAGQKEAEQSGWLNLTLQQRPVFVTETGRARRPELTIDSFWTIPEQPTTNRPVTFYARVKNLDDSVDTPTECTTWVRVSWNDSEIVSMCTAAAIAPGSVVTESIHMGVPGWVHEEGLLTADANPDMRYVERVGTDDNTAYLRLYIPYSPYGALDAVTPPGGIVNVPLVLFKLESRSWEADTLDSVPCDSALLIQKYFGLRDSVVHNTDSMGWFAFRPETSWTFLHGPGRYRFYLAVKDSWSASDAISDTSDSMVVFDTVAAVGGITISSGSRFARVTACTLAIAVADSGSGLRAMRFGSRLSNFTRNSGCAYSDGTWDFTGSGCGYDSALGLARLSVGTSGTSTMFQTIPPESLDSHWGDTLHLTADAIVAMPGCGTTAVGDLRFSYLFTHADPPLETLTTVTTIPFLGGIVSRTGTNNLDTGFVITQPLPDTFWQFAGGYVEAVVSGSGTSGGHVFCDNIRLETSGPYPKASWWRPCSTSALWNLGNTCGIKPLFAAFQDSAGTENAVPLSDSIILDNQPPLVHVGCPEQSAVINGIASISGYAYDPLIPNLDTFFERRLLQYRSIDSINWLPCIPDSCSFSPAYPSGGYPGDVYLGCWNTTELEDGDYFLKLSARDSAGNLGEQEVWVIVQNEGMRGESYSGPSGGGTGLGQGSIFVGSATGQILHLSDGLDSLDALTVSDSGSAAYVTAILENGDDSLLILDARNRRIHKLSMTGQNRRRLVSNLTLPVALSKDAHDNLWLVDRGTSRIGKFRSNGTLVFTRGGQGRDSTCLNSPEAIAVKDSLVYVADSRGDRIVVWDTAGNYRGSITGDFVNPTAIVVTDSGSIYVTDGSDGKLKGITPRGGRFLTITEANGSRLKGLVPSENRHSLFTLAQQPNLVYKYRIKSDDSMPGGAMSQGNLNLPKFLTLAQPFPNPARSRLSVSYALPRQTRVTLKLYDIAGKLVTTLASGDQKPGYYHVNWNRTDARGRSVPAGVYFCTLAAEGQRFSRKVVLAE